MLGYEPVVALNVLECNPERPAFRHRIACIDRQVQQCRLELRRIDLANERLVGLCDLQSDNLADCPPDQRLKLTNEHVHVERLRMEVLPTRKGQELSRQTLAALGRMPDGGELKLQPVVIDPAHQQVDVSEDHGQQVVKVMRDAPGELADGLHFLRLHQVADHLIDIILECCDLAGRLHCDRSREIPFTHSIRYLGDCSHLGRQVGCQLIDIIGYLAPQAGGIGDSGLTPQLTFSSHFTRHARYFGSERIELIHHRVDGVLQVEDFALYGDSDLSRQVALCNRSGDFGDIPHLPCEILSHQVHIAGEIHPYTRDTYHARLAPQFALSAHLVGHACYFGGKRIELIHHRVDGVLQVENFAPHFDGDLPGEIAIGNSGGHLGNIADLSR